MNGSKERYLLGQDKTSKSSGKSPLSSYKTALKQQLNGQKWWKMKWKVKPLLFFGVELCCFPVQCLEEFFQDMEKKKTHTKHRTGKQPNSYSCLTDGADFRFHHCSCDISSADLDLLSRNSTIPHGGAKWGGWSWERFVFPQDQT